MGSGTSMGVACALKETGQAELNQVTKALSRDARAKLEAALLDSKPESGNADVAAASSWVCIMSMAGDMILRAKFDLALTTKQDLLQELCMSEMAPQAARLIADTFEIHNDQPILELLGNAKHAPLELQLQLLMTTYSEDDLCAGVEAFHGHDSANIRIGFDDYGGDLSPEKLVNGNWNVIDPSDDRVDGLAHNRYNGQVGKSIVFRFPRRLRLHKLRIAAGNAYFGGTESPKQIAVFIAPRAPWGSRFYEDFSQARRHWCRVGRVFYKSDCNSVEAASARDVEIMLEGKYKNGDMPLETAFVKLLAESNYGNSDFAVLRQVGFYAGMPETAIKA